METKKRLIDANALRKQMFSYYGCVNENTSKSTYTGETLMNYEVADLIEDSIENAPTVDAVEVVHGRRVQKEFWSGGGTWRCSECGNQFMFLKDTPTTKEMNYCHKCGAKMDGGNEDG